MTKRQPKRYQSVAAFADAQDGGTGAAVGGAYLSGEQAPHREEEVSEPVGAVADRESLQRAD